MAERAVDAVVSGHVQGVGFRYATCRAARALGVSGWVANAPDGTVRVFAQGDVDALSDFVEFLRVGPGSAHVTDVEVSNRVPDTDVAGFEIRHRA